MNSSNCPFCICYDKKFWWYHQWQSIIVFDDDEDDVTLFSMQDDEWHIHSSFIPRKPLKPLTCAACKTYINKLVVDYDKV